MFKYFFIFLLALTYIIYGAQCNSTAVMLCGAQTISNKTLDGTNTISAASITTGTIGVANGGTGLTFGTSGGVLGYTATGILASSNLLTTSQLVIGGGAGATPSALAAGSQYQPLVMGAANPGYSALSLDQSAATSGQLLVARGGTALSSGTSGGILGFTASGTLASSNALTLNQLIIGGGAGATPSTLAAGSQYQSLIMGVANPGYSAIALNQSAATTSQLLTSRGGTGQDFSGSTGAISVSSGTMSAGTLSIANGGTGQITANPAFNALSPMTTLGDVIYGAASGVGTRLAGNTTTSKRFFTQTGDGVNSAAPTWAAIVSGDIPSAIAPATSVTSAFHSTSASTPATAGVFRCSNNQACIDARNAADSGNASFLLTTTNFWQISGSAAGIDLNASPLIGITTALGANNSAATPTWSFTSSTDAGMYHTAGSSNLQFATNGTNAGAIDSSHGWNFPAAVTMPGLASSSAPTTGSVCWTTSTGNLTVDTTVSCLASIRRIKEKIEPLPEGLKTVLQMQPVSYQLKKEYNPQNLGPMVGFIAEDVEKVDDRLVGRDRKGNLMGVRYMQYTAVLTKAIQEQQRQIEELKKEFSALKNTN